MRYGTLLRRLLVGGVAAALLGSACAASDRGADACVPEGEPLRLAFYAHFEPISYSAVDDPDGTGPAAHRGFEADLLTALEAMQGAQLSFIRSPVSEWADIWLAPASPGVDIVGGGITILESRTRNDAGETLVAFTSGHIAFRQSLLVRAADAQRFDSHDRLTDDVRVGVLRGTTGEARLLQLTGLADDDGVMAAGAQIDTPAGVVVADGTDDYTITAAGASATLDGRTSIVPPVGSMPQVVYLGDALGESELLDALDAGVVDAVARGEVGNGEAARASGGKFVTTALDSAAEHGGFALDARETELLACIDDKLNWLTDHRRIGYTQWRDDPGIFMERALLWDGA